MINNRIMSKVERRENGCWDWISSFNNKGYGTVWFKGKTCLAHRILYYLSYGIFPKEIDHLCRNRKCVNPDHLESVTHKENVNRYYSLKTHCKNGHIFDKKNTGRATDGTRRCRECNRLYMSNKKMEVFNEGNK